MFLPDGRDRGGVNFIAALLEVPLDPRCGVRGLAAGAGTTDGVVPGVPGVAAGAGTAADVSSDRYSATAKSPDCGQNHKPEQS